MARQREGSICWVEGEKGGGEGERGRGGKVGEGERVRGRWERWGDGEMG